MKLPNRCSWKWWICWDLGCCFLRETWSPFRNVSKVVAYSLSLDSGFFSGSCSLEVGLSSTILGLDDASFPVVIFFYQLYFVVQIFPEEASNGHLVSTDFRYPPLLSIPLNPIITTVGLGAIEERHSMSQWLSLSSCCTYL